MTLGLPEISEELDARHELVGDKLKAGDNKLETKTQSGLGLVVHAEPGKLLSYSIVDSAGKALSDTFQVQVTSGVAKAKNPTTCWQCGKDGQGHTHCWVIPCPVIVGPWEPGKALTFEQ